MAKKTIPEEREYIIPLRKQIMKVPRYKRTPKAVKAVKQFVAKHMRIENRDISKVKLDKYLNQELWFRGIQNPLTKIKVKVIKDKDNIRVELVDIPEKIKFQKLREEKNKQTAKQIKEKKKAEEKVKKEIEKGVEENVAQEQDESEKKEAVKEAGEKIAEAQAKQQKHIQGGKKKNLQPVKKALWK